MYTEYKDSASIKKHIYINKKSYKFAQKVWNIMTVYQSIIKMYPYLLKIYEDKIY